MKKLFLGAVLFLFCGFFSFPLDNQSSNSQKLPSKYRDIYLGMELGSVKKALKSDLLFGYRGERDISLLPGGNRISIETAGSSFIKRAWFQFKEERLYTMIFKLNTDIIDYYSIYSHFCKKYGEPLDLNPSRAIWEDENVRVLIERPLSVKYIDLTVFKKILDLSNTEKTRTEVMRENFINDF